ncbi:aromatic amino acid transport family protein [Aeromonas veronii]|uniref:aromatic amino acid transport family protein n=1 Tax=Aeromonas veronii TaxID=654 RepID=UPI002B47BD2C|nr:aromatic amino acid transport family protein [Aeromonas veronii]
MSNTVTGTQGVAASTEQGISSTQTTRWEKRDSTWVISLFGTAVGAGILFLPINAGMGGFWPLVVMALLVGPMTYLAHRGLARFVLSSKKPNADITEVVEEHFGVGITNTVESFMVNQLQMSAPPRWILSIVLIMGMMSVMLAGEKLMLKVTELLVYPLIAILAGISLYLIPDWTGAALEQVPSAKDFATTLWLTIPVLVFSFNHSPAISSFSLAQRRDHGDQAVEKADAILKRTAMVLLGFVMFFVFSCVMSLTPAQLAEAKAQNIAVLSYLANQHASPIISYFGPLVAFVAIVSSFFGHYLGAREGLKGMIVQNMRKSGKEPNAKKVEMFIIAFFILTLWGTAIANPSILGMIESLGGPIIATILFIMPMYAIKRVPAMAKYQGHISNVFVATMGMIAISAILYQLVG